MATIQDLENSAGALGQAIHAFDSSDQKAKADRAKADASDGTASASELAAQGDKQRMIDSHAAFDAVLNAFLNPAPSAATLPAPSPTPAP